MESLYGLIILICNASNRKNKTREPKPYMAILQPIINIAEILVTKNVTDAIISPGSRNAPLTIALARHPQINALSVSDERSAAFIAMGMAQVKNKPVAICCTSGSAAYNYAPAVAEAFFKRYL